MDLLRQLRARLGRQDPEGNFGTTRENVRITNLWHAVSILPRGEACAPARSIAGKRFLSSEGPPRLPLSGCTAATCTCRYTHHSDRRVHRRDSGIAAGTAGHPRRRADDQVER